MTKEAPAWRFDADALSVEERFGYRSQIWPHARTVVPIKPGMRVLDVGCGGGAFTRFIASCMDGDGEIVGVDRDEDLLERARATAPQGPELKVEMHVMDAADLDFPDDHFDAVVSGFLLCVIPSPLGVLREMRRVTKPGGIVASLSCFCKSGIFPSFEGLHGFDGHDRLHNLWRRFFDTRRIHLRNPALGLPNGRDLDVWGDSARAGLVDLRIHGYLTVLAPSDARWSDADAVDFMTERRRIELGVIDGLTADQREEMERAGLSGKEIDELRALLEKKYDWLAADVRRVRDGMELLTEPSVLIVGRAPD